MPEDDGGILHRPIPIDPLPRRLGAAEWQTLERALVQRTLALDAFIQDVYGQQRILRAGRIPAHLVYGSASYLRGASGPAAQRPGQIAVAGIDLVKVEGHWLVLEDNVRVPSGISYALAARWAMRKVLGRAMPAFGAARLEDYPRRLRAVLRQRAPSDGELVVLSPGPLNAAVIVTLVAGLLGALIAALFGASTVVAVLVAAVVFLVANLLIGFLSQRAFFKSVRSLPARFPSPSPR